MGSAIRISGDPVDCELFRVLIHEVFGERAEVLNTDIRQYCLSRVYRVGSVLKDAISILVWLKILENAEPSIRRGRSFGIVQGTRDVESLAKAIADLVVARLEEEEIAAEVFTPRSLAWNPEQGLLLLLTWRIPMPYFAFVTLLKSLRVLAEGDTDGVLVVSRTVADRLIAAIAKGVSQQRGATRSLTPEQLERLKRRQEIQGGLAEEFVIAAERQRLAGHPNLNLLRRVSLDDISSGYDILSFESVRSATPDRFIEVKSYRGHEHFFLSVGEADAARHYGDAYYLYVVDVDRMGSEGYRPRILQNPTISVFGLSAEWDAQPTEWYIERVTPSRETAGTPTPMPEVTPLVRL